MSKKTPERIAHVLDGLRKGHPIVAACQAAGISDETWRRWRKDDPELSQRSDEVQAEAMTTLHDRVRDAGEEDWRASSWLLERRYPEQYGKQDRVDHTFTLDMPGLLEASTPRATAWLASASDADWKAMDQRAARGELTDLDYEILEDVDDDAGPSADEDPAEYDDRDGGSLDG